jgi:dihydroorotate dehydrogenase (NAD+) catalytic subunit
VTRLGVAVGDVQLRAPVCTASGTAGHGAELGAYFDLARLGAVVVKSLAAIPWAGNPAPRLAPVAAGMLNSVGLQGPGVAGWIADELPALEKSGAAVVVSIWGRRVEDFAEAARLLAGASPSIIALEVNVSCPNLEDRGHMFAHSASATTAATVATAASGLPRWVKLSPNTPDLVEIAGAALDAGAAALVLTNTLLGLTIDLDHRRPVLGGIGGGLSGAAVHPVALRCVYECHKAYPEAPIVGVGGIARAEDAVEFLLAGATAVEVGTATLADPHAPIRVLEGVEAWCEAHGVGDVTELIGAGHG